MDEPLLSIVTPTHNLVSNDLADDFNLLVTLLDLQTYPNIEHVIIDNASTDSTVEMLKDYKNKGYLNFFSEPDTGKFDAFNKGIMHSKGKYIAFCSCDDFYQDITAFNDIVSIMEAEQADFTFSPSYCRHFDGYTFLFMPAMHNAFQVVPCSRQAMVFKKQVLEREGYFNKKYKILSDFDLIIRLMMKKYKGIYYPANYTTVKLGKKSSSNPAQTDLECKHIFFSNFKNLYPLNDEVLDKMVKYSEFPRPLLEKLAGCFPEADKELFFERCEKLREVRTQAQQEIANNAE